jgi:hypothetical protein
MLIELRYQCYIHACSRNYLRNIFLLFFLSFSDSFVWSVRIVFRDVRTVLLYVRTVILVSGRYGWFVQTFILLVRTSVFLQPLRGTMFGRHLSSVRTVNPVGLNRILPAPQPIFSPFLALFVVLCVFLVIFMRISHMHVSSLYFLSTPGIFLILFY